MPNFVNDRHALYVGWVLGVALKFGIRAMPIVDSDGNYTDHIEIMFGNPGNQVTLQVVVPPPPKDWIPK